MHFFHNKSGFTIIEILVVLGLIGIVFLIGVLSFTDIRARINLNAASNELVADFQSIKFKSMTKEIEIEGVKTSKFGILTKNSEPDRYYFFAFKDKNNNEILEDDEITYINPGLKKVTSYFKKLPSNITFSPSKDFLVYFDRRGIPRKKTGEFSENILELASKKDKRQVTVSLKIFVKK
ncbi:MAG: type II secretion system protein [Acidobacteriota bacterium]